VLCPGEGQLASIADSTDELILAMGRYIGESFDNLQLVTYRALRSALGKAPLGFAEPMKREWSSTTKMHFGVSGDVSDDASFVQFGIKSRLIRIHERSAAGLKNFRREILCGASRAPSRVRASRMLLTPSIKGTRLF
jgi:hypothetical protein